MVVDLLVSKMYTVAICERSEISGCRVRMSQCDVSIGNEESDSFQIGSHLTAFVVLVSLVGHSESEAH
jgi:hypothetical protein